MIEDDLQAKYDLKSLSVRKLGAERKSFGRSTGRLETDAAKIFPSTDAVNEVIADVLAVLKDKGML